MKRAIAIVVVIAVCGAGLYWLYRSLTDARPLYRVTKVCKPCTGGWAINNRGEVAGVLERPGKNGTGGPPVHATFWQPGVGTTDLGTFGGPSSRSADINDAGHVIGSADLPTVRKADGSKHQRTDGFLWKRGRRMRRMIPLRGHHGVESVSPVGINNRGYVVGCATFLRHQGYRAFLWDPKAGILDLGTLGGKYSCAVDVNDRGQVIGNSDVPASTPDKPSHAFLWESGKGMTDLGTLGGTSSYARAINNAGRVVGSSQAEDSSMRAFLWARGRGMTELGMPGGASSSATGINEAGVVVGDWSLPGEVEPRAFFWEESLGMLALQDRIDPTDSLINAVILRTPKGINNRGQILVDGEFPSEDRTYAVILSPVPKD